MTPVCARCRRVMITTTRCGMQLTCWEHCLRPTAANSKRTWPVALNAGGRHRTLRVPALLSQLDRDEVAAISESAPTVVASGLSPELLPSLLAAVHRRRRRTRLITWVASSAAAAVLAIGVLVGVQGHPRHRSGRPCRRCRWPRSARSCWRPRCRSAASLGDVHQPAVRLPGAAVCFPRHAGHGCGGS